MCWLLCLLRIACMSTVRATSHMLVVLITLQCALHVFGHTDRFACVSLVPWRLSIRGRGRSVRTTFEKFHRSAHLMVSVWSVGHMNMYCTIPMAIGRQRSPRFIGATSLGMVSLAMCQHGPSVVLARTTLGKLREIGQSMVLS